MAVPDKSTPRPTVKAALEAERYRLLVESVRDYAIFLLDSTGHIISWNIGAQNLKGYTKTDILGQHFSIFYPKKDLDAGKPARELVDAIKHGRIEDEDWRVRKDGSRFWANVVITALFDADGKHVGFAKVTRDVTDRKQQADRLLRANHKLEAQRAELERLNTIKDEFVSLASHQLRTPATGVKQFLGLLLQGYAGPLTEQQFDYIQKAYDSNDRQIDMVNSLLHTAQLDAGKVVLRHETSDIDSLVGDVIDETVDTFKRRCQTLTYEKHAGVIEAAVDPLRLRMVLENLIDNASKYTPDGGKIHVTLARQDDFVVITIADSGVGIHADDMPKLYEKFSRIPNALSDSVGGSGLGLYWAAEIIKLHGGTISVESAPQAGSTFEVRLPLHPQKKGAVR